MTLICHDADGQPFPRMARMPARKRARAVEDVEGAAFPPPPDFFAPNPLGQDPVPIRDGMPLFPAGIALVAPIEAAHGASTPRGPQAGNAGPVDRQLPAAMLSPGGLIGALRYRAWAGLAPAGPDRLGFDPGERARERIARAGFAARPSADRSDGRPAGRARQLRRHGTAPADRLKTG